MYIKTYNLTAKRKRCLAMYNCACARTYRIVGIFRGVKFLWFSWFRSQPRKILPAKFRSQYYTCTVSMLYSTTKFYHELAIIAASTEFFPHEKYPLYGITQRNRQQWCIHPYVVLCTAPCPEQTGPFLVFRRISGSTYSGSVPRYRYTLLSWYRDCGWFVVHSGMSVTYKFAPNLKFHSARQDRETVERVEPSRRKHSRQRYL